MPKKWQNLLATVLVTMVAVVLILAGALKLIGVGAEDMVEGLRKANLIQHQRLISITAIVCGVLLLVPRCAPVNAWLATAYWGGAIVAHLTYNDSVLMPASFLALLWAGLLLRAAAAQRPAVPPADG